MDSRMRLLVWIIVSIICINSALAASIILQPNETFSKDSYLNEDNPNNNYGNLVSILVDSEAAKPLQGIIQFNISSIPANAIINSANFQIYYTGTSGDTVGTQIKRVTSNWLENGVTWNSNGIGLWTNPGGDYATTNYSILTIGTTPNIWLNYNITTLVKQWYNGTYNNYGMIIKPTYAPGNNEKILASSNYATSTLRPKLTILYTVSTPLIFTLISPDDLKEFNNTKNVTFTFNVHDSQSTYNCSLYINSIQNQTNSSVINGTNTSFIVNNIDYGFHSWYVKCGLNNSEIRHFEITELNKPSINFISKVPDPVGTTYAFNDTVKIKYNATDDYQLAHVDLFYKTNTTTSDIWSYVNGITNSNFVTIQGTNQSINWTFELDDFIYPATYNYVQEEMENTTHIFKILNSTQDYKIEFLNVSDNRRYGFFELMLNYTGTPDKLDIYYCNSSYSSGNYINSSNCAFLKDIFYTDYYDHIHNANSWHKTITFPIIDQKFQGVKVTSKSYFIIKGPDLGEWKIYGINDTLRSRIMDYSEDGGLNWADTNITADSHVHQFDYNSQMNYYACAYDSFNNENCTEVESQLFNLTAIEPSGFQITKPISGVYATGTLLEILWTQSESPINATLTYNLYLTNTLNTRILNITKDLPSNPYYFDTTNISGIFKIEVEACSLSVCTSEYSDIFQLTIGSFSPVIIVGGETYAINDTYDAEITLNYADNPYIKANQSTRIGFDHIYNGSKIIDSILRFKINNQTVDMTYSTIYNEYSVWLNFPLNETGNFNYSVEAINPSYETFLYEGEFIVRDYNFIRVALWQDCKWYQVWCSDQTKYKNRFGYAFATPIPDDKMAYLNYSWANQLQPLKDFGIWGERVMNISKLYRMENKNFNAQYKNGEALLFVPSNESYALSFFAANFLFDNEDGYGYTYYSKKYTENLFLDVIFVDPDFDYNKEYYVTSYELHKTAVWTFWILFGIIAMFGLIVIAFIMAYSPVHGLISLLVWGLILPVIWLALKIIFWVISL